jgi:hypothetical protein
MMTMNRKYLQLELQTLLAIASSDSWSLSKGHAIYELACRALLDKSLLPEAWRCIGNEIIVVPRKGPALGQAAAALLLDSGVIDVERTMVESLASWSIEQQTDFLLWLIPENERKSFEEKLNQEYGLQLKAKLKETGEIIFD